MRALRVTEAGPDLVELPEPSAEAIVRVTLSGICNTDLELARGYMGFRGTIGHEFVGVIEHDGGTLARGTRVVGEINAGCGACARCAAGDPRHCATRTVLGIVGRDGAHADFVALPARNLIAVPDGVDDRDAVFVEPLAAACGILERCPHVAGARVAVLGDGKLGLLCAMVLHAHRADVTLIGKHPEKLALARGIPTLLVDDARRRYDVVVEATGHASGFSRALALLVPQGTLVLKSTFHGGTPIDTAPIVVDEITIVGSRCGRFAPALDLLAHRAIDLDGLIAGVLPLADGVRALQLAAAPGVLKVLLSR